MASQATIYRNEAFSYLDRQTDAIWETANPERLGVSATALAGAMAKERDAYARRRPIHYASDLWAWSLLANHSVIQNYYNVVHTLGVQDASDWRTKYKYPILMDIGVANFKMTTAIGLLEKYNTVWYPTSDPLDLKQSYNNNYRLLLEDLLNENSDVTAKFYGLMIKEADEFFAANVNADYWNNLSPEMKDALRITYTNFGMKKMEVKKLGDVVRNWGTLLPSLTQSDMFFSVGRNPACPVKRASMPLGRSIM